MKRHVLSAFVVAFAVGVALADPFPSRGRMSPVAGGSGSVTSVSVVAANGFSCSVATATTTPALTCSLGVITPSQVDLSGSGLGVNAVKLANGVGINFSLADNDAYLSRTGTDTLRVGGGVNSTFIAGAFVANKTGAVDSFTAGSTSGNALKMLDGVKVNFSTADANAYLYRSAANIIRTPGSFTVDATMTATGALIASSTVNKGTITLSSGTGTATVTSGAICTCTDTAATPVVLRCVVSTTTLTASEVSGTSSHAIAYVCL